MDEEEQLPTNVFIHNNFILDNGQRLVDEQPVEEAPTEPTLSLAGYGGQYNLTGAGILFEQGIGDNAGAEVFQNFIAGNRGAGIQVGFDQSGIPVSAVVVEELTGLARELGLRSDLG